MAGRDDPGGYLMLRLAASIYGGTNEIMKNIVSKAVLGLSNRHHFVIPAQPGIQGKRCNGRPWTPAFTGVTNKRGNLRKRPMDFEYTEEQRLLRESLDRLLGDSYGFDKRKKSISPSPTGLAGLCGGNTLSWVFLGLPFSEEQGGFGGGGVETMVVMEALGRVIALEPYLATVVLAGTALKLAGSTGAAGGNPAADHRRQSAPRGGAW